MVSTIGALLGSNRLITGFGAHRRRRTIRHHVGHGEGVGRKIVGAIVRKVGHALTDKLASAVSGGSYKITGAGKRRVGRPRGRRPRAMLSLPSLVVGGRKHYRRRAPRRHLSGMGIHRRRLIHRIF